MYPLPLRPSLETQANYTVEWLLMAKEIGADGFAAALRKAVHESEYFPTIAKIRNCAGLNAETQSAAEADAAWLLVQDWIREWHGSQGGVYKGRDKATGKIIMEQPPKLPSRVAHAVRLVGGIDAIANVSDKGLPFLRKDFAEAFDRYYQANRIGAEMQLEAPEAKKLLADISSKRTPTLIGKPGVENDFSFPERRFAPALTDEEIAAKKLEAEHVAAKYQPQERAQ